MVKGSESSALASRLVQHVYFVEAEHSRFTCLRELLEHSARYNYGIVHTQVTDAIFQVQMVLDQTSNLGSWRCQTISYERISWGIPS
jgi:hypothetical protein